MTRWIREGRNRLKKKWLLEPEQHYVENTLDVDARAKAHANHAPARRRTVARFCIFLALARARSVSVYGGTPTGGMHTSRRT